MSRKFPNQLKGGVKPKEPAQKPQPDNSNKKDKLACWFYSLAITYYCIQLIEKVGSHISMPTTFDLSSYVSTSLIDNILQCVTISLMIFRYRK